jgi:3-hydroxyanthranilate 3,4-dioxygenase
MHPNAMLPLDLEKITAAIASGTRPNQVLWQTEDSIAFVARGREGRSEFHVDPSDEVMYMLKGDMNLHYRTPEGEEKVAVIRP